MKGMTNMADKHPLLLEAIENIEAASACNRGMYPITKAANVFKEDGTSLEPTPDPDPPVVNYVAKSGSDYFSDTDLTTKVGTLDADTPAVPVKNEEYFTISIDPETYTAAKDADYYSDTAMQTKVGSLSDATPAEPVEGQTYFTVEISSTTYYVSGDDVTADPAATYYVSGDDVEEADEE